MIIALSLALVNMVCGGLVNYNGGILGRKHNIVYLALIWNLTALAYFVLAAALGARGPTFSHDLANGLLTGVFISSGVFFQFRATARAPFSRILPIVAIVASSTPPIYNFLRGQHQSWLLVVAIATGGYALSLLARNEVEQESKSRVPPKEIFEAVISGISWGGVGVTLGFASGHSPNATFLGAHSVALVFNALMILWLHVDTETSFEVIGKASLIGIIVVIADLSFVFAIAGARHKFLTAAVLISNLSLAIVVVLAHFFAGERLTKRKNTGLVLVLVALALVTLASR